MDTIDMLRSVIAVVEGVMTDGLLLLLLLQWMLWRQVPLTLNRSLLAQRLQRYPPLLICIMRLLLLLLLMLLVMMLWLKLLLELLLLLLELWLELWLELLRLQVSVHVMVR